MAPSPPDPPTTTTTTKTTTSSSTRAGTGSIITIQVGTLANRVGHTLWCLEEELRKRDTALESPLLHTSALWHTSATTSDAGDNHHQAPNYADYEPDRTTYHSHDAGLMYTPRLVSIDAKGSVGSFQTLTHQRASTHARQASPDASELWHGKASVIQQQDATEQKTADVASDWTSQIHLQLDPTHTFIEFPIQQCVDTATTVHDFKYVSQGMVANSSNSGMHHLLESIGEAVRYWVEASDRLTGFHLLTDIDSGWCGLTASIIEQLRDDYGEHVPIVTFVTMPMSEDQISTAESSSKDHTHRDRVRQLLNTCVGMQLLAEQSSLVVPIDAAHTPARHGILSREELQLSVMANAIHGFTLPYRTARQGCFMADYVLHFARQAECNIVGISVEIPLDTQHNQYFQINTRCSETDNRQQQLLKQRSAPDHHQRDHHKNESEHPTYYPLWHPLQRTVIHCGPFTDVIREAEVTPISKRNSQHNDPDDDYDLSDDEDALDDGSGVSVVNRFKALGRDVDDVLGEWVVVRGVDDWRLHMQFTNAYDELNPNTSHRSYTFLDHPTVNANASNNKHLHHSSSLTDVHSSRLLIGTWLEQLVRGLSAVLGERMHHLKHLASADSVEARTVLQQYAKDGFSREDWRTQVITGLESRANAYLNRG